MHDCDAIAWHLETMGSNRMRCAIWHTVSAVQTKWLAIVGIFVAVAMGADQSNAATIDVDTVLGPDHPYVDESIIVVDGENPPTILTIVNGALVGDALGGEIVPIGLEAFRQSQIRMVQGGISAGQRSVLLHDQSSFRMLAGGIDRGIEARHQSRVTIEGGFWEELLAYDSSQIRINSPRDESESFVRTFDESHAVIEGTDEFLLIAAESSTVVIRGGEFHQVDATGNSSILVNGGAFSDSSPRAFDNSTVHVWSVRSIGEEKILAADEGIVHVYGTGLRFDVEVDLDITFDVIVGKLADGEDFRAEYAILDEGQIILHEVPEPGALALLAVGAGALLAARRMGSLAGAEG